MYARVPTTEPGGHGGGGPRRVSGIHRAVLAQQRAQGASVQELHDDHRIARVLDDVVDPHDADATSRSSNGSAARRTRPMPPCPIVAGTR
jgi:hypothetical protein